MVNVPAFHNKSRDGSLIPSAIFFVLIAILPISSARAEPQASSDTRWKAKAQTGGLSAVQLSTYLEFAELHTCKLSQSSHWDIIDPLFSSGENPMIKIQKLGIEALPYVAEALDDTTPSKTVTNSRGVVHVWRVNELAAWLIRDLADREFVIGEWGGGTVLREIGEKPDLAPEFKKLVQDWYEENKGKSVEDRKIADLESNLRNRLDAMIWLGKNKSKKAAPFIIARIEKILGGKEVSSSTRTEVAEASSSLGLIGDASSLRGIRKACEHLSYWIEMSYRPADQGRWGTGSGQMADLFKAYHGMALLGEKEYALTELGRLLREYGEEMEESTRREYEKLLKEAEAWETGGAGL